MSDSKHEKQKLQHGLQLCMGAGGEELLLYGLYMKASQVCVCFRGESLVLCY